MNTTNIQRKARITWLEIKIASLRLMMSLEVNVTEQWKCMARRLTYLVNQRNQLRTLEDIRRIEKRRGLS